MKRGTVPPSLAEKKGAGICWPLFFCGVLVWFCQGLVGIPAP